MLGMSDSTITDVTTTIDLYLEAYSEPDPDRRARLVDSVFAPDAVLVDPPFVATGRLELVGAFGAVLDHYPGHRFQRRSVVDEHHGVARYTWSLEAPDGSTAISGLDVVTFDDDGSIVKVVGFMGDLAPAD